MPCGTPVACAKAFCSETFKRCSRKVNHSYGMKNIADKSELLHSPQPGSTLRFRSETSSSLAARGLRDATVLVISPDKGATFLDARALHVLIARTIFAVSRDERRQPLSHSLFILRPTSLTMVATDGHRLSFVEKVSQRVLESETKDSYLFLA